MVRRNILSVEAKGLDRCPLCNTELENPPHLLLHCMVSWEVWSQIIKCWEIVWVRQSNLYNLLSWWFSHKFSSVEKGYWEITFLAVLWSLWLERNQAIFNAKPVNVIELVDRIKTKIALWTTVCFAIHGYSVEDIKRCLQGIRRLKLAKSVLS